jgi:hypothetical protein
LGISTGACLLFLAYTTSLFVCRDDVCGKPNFVESLYPFIALHLFPYAAYVAPGLVEFNLPSLGHDGPGALLALVQWPLYGLIFGLACRLRRSGKGLLAAAVLLLVLTAHVLMSVEAGNRVRMMLENRVYEVG